MIIMQKFQPHYQNRCLQQKRHKTSDEKPTVHVTALTECHIFRILKCKKSYHNYSTAAWSLCSICTIVKTWQQAI